MLATRLHNLFDYIFALMLLLLPFDFGFVSLDAARNVFVLSGSIWILYSLMTNYEYSVLRLLPLKFHLVFDFLLATTLALAPSLFHYRDQLTPTLLRLHWLAGAAIALHMAPVLILALWRRIKYFGQDQNWSATDLARPLTPSSQGR